MARHSIKDIRPDLGRPASHQSGAGLAIRKGDGLVPKKPCGSSGCNRLVSVGQSYCAGHERINQAARAASSDAGRTSSEARKWYKRTAWHGKNGRRLRQLALEPVCRMCPEWSKQAATVADHVIPHRGDHALFWFGELQSLCKLCHDSKKQRMERRGWTDALPDDYEARRLPTGLGRSRIPLTIVCGPPASGKSTYVDERAAVGDLVIDLDAIMQDITGKPVHHTGKAGLRQALERRNGILDSLASDRSDRRAWFIVSAPAASDRRHWHGMLGGDLVVLDIPLEECKRRILADQSRAGQQERMIRAATDWWKAQAG